jgi:hypothetical protein
VLVAAALALLVVALGGMALYNRQAAGRGPVPVAEAPAQPANRPEAGITEADRLLKFKQFLAMGEELLAKKDYAEALMQFYIAQAFASPADTERLRKKIELSQRLAQSRA